jgi:hypothetical protein
MATSLAAATFEKVFADIDIGVRAGIITFPFNSKKEIFFQHIGQLMRNLQKKKKAA